MNKKETQQKLIKIHDDLSSIESRIKEIKAEVVKGTELYSEIMMVESGLSDILGDSWQAVVQAGRNYNYATSQNN